MPWFQDSNKHFMMFLGQKLIKLAQGQFLFEKVKFKVNWKVQL